MARLKIGDLAAFSYPARHLEGTRAHDKYPSVLVLHPLWKNNVHGLNFNYLSDDEINVIRMLIDPGFQLKYIENLSKKNPNLVREFDRIIGSAGNAVITSPYDFYSRVIRPFIITRGWDPYRRYVPSKMRGVRVVQPSSVITGESERWNFGAGRSRDRGRSEKDILKDLAGKESSAPGFEGGMTPTEKRFVQRLQGNALTLFKQYKRKFEASRGPRLPTWGA